MAKLKSSERPIVVDQTRFQIARYEWIFVLSMTIVLLFLSATPYVLTSHHSLPRTQSTGIFLGVADVNAFLSWMHAYTKNYLIQDPLTSEPHLPFYTNVFWWVLARAMLLSSLPAITILYGTGFICIIAFSITLYWCCATFITTPKWRMLAYILATFTPSFDWLFSLAKLDTLIPPFVFDGTTGVSLMGLPHDVLAMTLLMIAMCMLMRYHQTGNTRYAVVVGVTLFFHSWFHPFEVFIVLVTAGVLCGIELINTLHALPQGTKKVQPGLRLVLCYSLIIGSSFPPLLWYVAATHWNPVFAAISKATTDSRSPDILAVFQPWDLLVSYSVAFLGTLVGVTTLRLSGKTATQDRVLLCWIITPLLLPYIPILPFVLHFRNGLQIILALLAGIAFERLSSQKKRKIPISLHDVLLPRIMRILASVCLAVLIIIPFLRLETLLILVSTGHHDGTFMTNDQQSTLNWLTRHSTVNDVILTRTMTEGAWVAIYTNARPVWAHDLWTVNYQTKREEAGRFFSTMDPPERLAILQKYHTTYIWASIADAMPNGILPPSNSARNDPTDMIFYTNKAALLTKDAAGHGWLKESFRTKTSVIYRVNPNSTAA